ncbi:UPF0149 family protein [Pseudomonas akapageensis]|uniref:UPF0149 family protein n=1 Tax=Pseudomonas akapageensis TaxID=2609961 RepID=UPI00140BCAE7|nr:UPF0149 family protein [Pseudomonas akapageensis]
MAYTISNQPLTLAQFDFIQDQLDKHAGETSIRSISELDGYFTAIISYIEDIHFNDWYAAFWGGAEHLPKWKSEQTYQRFFDLLIQHMNQIATMLVDYPDAYSPIFNQAEDREGLDVEDWCLGYQRGVNVAGGWADLPEHEKGLLGLITMHTLGLDVISKGKEDPEQAFSSEEAFIEVIKVAAVGLHQYWAQQRTASQAITHEPVRAEPKVGRNDPCPCGSGKKYKQCCMR